MNSDSENAAMVSAGATGLGLMTAGPAGVGFLTQPIPTPLWFLLAAVALPTGDLLAVLRAFIGRQRRKIAPKQEADS